jgi:hypothetical protein
MTKKSDDKGLLNEVLPDPKQGERDLRGGSPRDRTSAYLRKVMAAAAGIALNVQGASHADVTPPPKDGDKKPGDSRPKDGNKPKEPEPPPPYGVVDPMPMPPPDTGKPGILKLSSTPSGAAISIDGVAQNLKTPQKKLKLAPGMHTITLTTDKGVVGNFTVEIKPGQTLTQSFEVKPEPKK